MQHYTQYSVEPKYLVYRIVAGRPVYLGSRGTPETLRRFVCQVTNFH